MKIRETKRERRDRLTQAALRHSRPFTIRDVGDGYDYLAAAELLNDLARQGHLTVDKKHRPNIFKWVND